MLSVQLLVSTGAVQVYLVDTTTALQFASQVNNSCTSVYLFVFVCVCVFVFIAAGDNKLQCAQK